MDPERTPAVNRTRLLIALVVGAVGVVWVLQGIGVLPGSFMSNDPVWALIGSALVVLAAAYAALPRLRG